MNWYVTTIALVGAFLVGGEVGTQAEGIDWHYMWEGFLVYCGAAIITGVIISWDKDDLSKLKKEMRNETD